MKFTSSLSSLLFVTPLALAAEPPSPFGACPTPAQVAWHEMEFYGFVHFTTNTFTDKEWGFGDEDPAIFAPTAFDPSQWARVARASGMTGLILTAKHHDGFCLWPSAFTDHTVEASSYEGDVVGEFVEAARAEGLLVGLYLSPWDRNHPEYGREAYVEYFRSQWKELIEAYGPLFEIWFDGANGGDGYYGGARETRRIDRTSYYGWPTTNALVQKWNPGVIIFSDAGPGCRWVGNERGFSSETSWQTIDLEGMYPGVSHDHLAEGDQGGSHWVGVEVDVSIRPGWFWHESQNDQVKSPEQLVEIWYASVGRGANLLLNVPPDRRGLFHERDVESLLGMRRILDATFDEDVLSGGRASASTVRGGEATYDASRLLDDDRRSYWATDDSVTTGWVEVTLDEPRTFDVVRVREAIELGQRVESFGVDAWVDGAWREVTSGTTIGPCRLLRFEAVTTDRVRLRIESSMACPVISEFGAYRRPS